MTERNDEKVRASRRGFLAAAAGLAAVAGTGVGAGVTPAVSGEMLPGPASDHRIEPFWGPHQGGIITPAQRHSYFAAFDLVTDDRADVVKLLQAWTAAAARLCAGKPAQPLDGTLKPVGGGAGAANPPATVSYVAAPTAYGPSAPGAMAADTGEAIGLSPQRLTLTFGFGAGLFVKDGKDRYGLASHRPAALVDLPKFAGDELIAAHTGGDLSVQACADDPQVAFHAVRQLARIGAAVAHLRWVQAGFLPNFGTETPRNLMGFKDGTINPPVHDPKAMDRYVWVGEEGPDWMHGGSYVIARRIRMALEHWDRISVAFQEQTFGRHKCNGAPLGRKSELDPLDLDATDKDGNPIIPENAHVRVAAAATNQGAQILRRPYSYDNGFDFVAERWPPWRAELEYDAGLLFVCYQRDPRTGFIRLYERMSKFDMLNQFVTHVGSGVFACPGGAADGRFIGQSLLDRNGDAAS